MPPLVLTATLRDPVFVVGLNAKLVTSKPTVLPALLTSWSAPPPDVLEKLACFSDTAVNFSVWVVLCALAIAGTRTAPAPARTTAAPAAAMDVRIVMDYLRVSWAALPGRPL